MKLLQVLFSVCSSISVPLFSSGQCSSQKLMAKFVTRPKLWLLICFSLVSLTAFSQGSETGCLLPNNRVYTNKGILGTYFSSPSTGLSTDYCSWSPNSGPICYVCNGTLNIFGVCLTATTQGVEGTFTMVACSLDDYVNIFALLIASTGAYYITRKAIFQTINSILTPNPLNPLN